jgi:hypothetical protein
MSFECVSDVACISGLSGAAEKSRNRTSRVSAFERPSFASIHIPRCSSLNTESGPAHSSSALLSNSLISTHSHFCPGPLSTMNALRMRCHASQQLCSPSCSFTPAAVCRPAQRASQRSDHQHQQRVSMAVSMRTRRSAVVVKAISTGRCMILRSCFTYGAFLAPA